MCLIKSRSQGSFRLLLEVSVLKKVSGLFELHHVDVTLKYPFFNISQTWELLNVSKETSGH